METQLASAFIVPAFCHVNPAFSYDTTAAAVAKQPLIQPVLPRQPQIIVSPTAGHVMLHAPQQQLVSVLPHDAQHQLMPPSGDYIPQNLIIRPLQYVNTATAQGAPIFDPNHHHHHQHTLNALQQIQTKLSGSSEHCISLPLHKTQQQRRKKVSPSAKRRSRLRLIAFLEAKKEKCRLLSTNSEGEKIEGRTSESGTDGEASPTSVTSSDVCSCYDDAAVSGCQANSNFECEQFAMTRSIGKQADVRT